jgi:uroporphyrinogen decarboxylase
MMKSHFSKTISPDWEGFLRCLSRQGTPRRVYFIELYIDSEMKQAICDRFGLVEDLNPSDPHFSLQREIILQCYLGYDYVRCGVDNVGISIERMAVGDTANLQRDGGRRFVNEHRGPITSWAEFEAYPWPDPAKITTRNLEWFEENLPEDMCIVASGGFAHFAEYLTWLMGYEMLCYALFEQRDLVAAISQRLLEIYRVVVQRMLQFERVKVIWGSDDMGFRSGTLLSPRDLRAFVLPGHRLMAQAAHAAGRPYLLHSCGKLDVIMNDLLEDTTDRRLFLPAPPALPTACQRDPETIASLSLPHF